VPTYQYVCTSCEQPLEAVQSFSDAALTECPSCGGRLRKVYGSVGVVFKGSGFYKTDSRAQNGNGGSGKAEGGSGDGASSTDKGGSGDKAAAPAASSTGASSTGGSGSGSGSTGGSGSSNGASNGKGSSSSSSSSKAAPTPAGKGA
jgi:putative FmdB family regulatory protein